MCRIIGNTSSFIFNIGTLKPKKPFQLSTDVISRPNQVNVETALDCMKRQCQLGGGSKKRRKHRRQDDWRLYTRRDIGCCIPNLCNTDYDAFMREGTVNVWCCNKATNKAGSIYMHKMQNTTAFYMECV